MASAKTTSESKVTPQGPSPENVRARLRRSPFATIRDIFVGLLVVVLFFIVFEGVSSVALALKDFADAPIIAERLHTHYDSLLGWSNIPGIFIPDMYGPSASVRINSQGYRNSQEFSQRVPIGRLRIICSGDSFTFGYGVSNEQTWCQSMESRDGRLQTVNMGQGGYGFDQMFLWYRRDVDRLDTDVHVVAAIQFDYYRMLSDEFRGYSKPVLKLDHGQLVAGNTPVPQRIWQARLVAISERLDRVSSVSVLKRLIQKLHPAESKAPHPSQSQINQQLRQVVLSTLDAFRDLDRSRNRVLVLVYLPTFDECYLPEASDWRDWREWINAEASARGIVVIDLLPDFLGLPVRQASAMFIQQISAKYAGARGHYSIAGNKFVADRIYTRLLSIPDVKHRLDSIEAR